MSNPSLTDIETPQARLYLDLLKKCLTRYEFGEAYQPIEPPTRPLLRHLYPALRRFLSSRGIQCMRQRPFDATARAEGRDWPAEAETMIGLTGLDNLQHCVTEVLRCGVPGDLIETGVWRGGSVIFMRALLQVYGDTERVVWVADSFQGFPQPEPDRYPADAGNLFWMEKRIAIPLTEVQENFRRYGLLDTQVRFLPGWFCDTLPSAPIERLAILRLDGDMYGSTMDALRALYPKLSVGGYVIVDDYGALPDCRAAVEDFRAEHGIHAEIHSVDWTRVFWQRQ